MYVCVKGERGDGERGRESARAKRIQKKLQKMLHVDYSFVDICPFTKPDMKNNLGREERRRARAEGEIGGEV
jgi:phage-related protein